MPEPNFLNPPVKKIIPPGPRGPKLTPPGPPRAPPGAPGPKNPEKTKKPVKARPSLVRTLQKRWHRVDAYGPLPPRRPT